MHLDCTGLSRSSIHCAFVLHHLARRRADKTRSLALTHFSSCVTCHVQRRSRTQQSLPGSFMCHFTYLPPSRSRCRYRFGGNGTRANKAFQIDLPRRKTDSVAVASIADLELLYPPHFGTSAP